MPGYLTCCISYMPVPPNRLVVVRAGEAVYHFDIDSLYKAYESSTHSVPVNPYTNVPLSDNIARRVLAYGRPGPRTVLVDDISYLIDPKETVGSALCKVLSHRSDKCVDVLRDGVSLYNYDLNTDLIGQCDCIRLVPFLDTGSQLVAMEKLHKYTNTTQSCEERPSTSPTMYNNYIVVGNIFVPSWA